MLTKSDAVALVAEKLQTLSTPDNPYIVIEAETIEKAFGWVFFYNTKKFLDTGDIRESLVGGGPILVNKHTASMEFLGTSKTPEQAVRAYERKLSTP